MSINFSTPWNETRQSLSGSIFSALSLLVLQFSFKLICSTLSRVKIILLNQKCGSKIEMEYFYSHHVALILCISAVVQWLPLPFCSQYNLSVYNYLYTHALCALSVFHMLLIFTSPQILFTFIHTITNKYHLLIFIFGFMSSLESSRWYQTIWFVLLIVALFSSYRRSFVTV